MLGRKSGNKKLLANRITRTKADNEYSIFHIPLPLNSVVKEVLFYTDKLLGFSATPFNAVFFSAGGGASYGSYNFKENVANPIKMHVEEGGMVLCYAGNLDLTGCVVWYN